MRFSFDDSRTRRTARAVVLTTVVVVGSTAGKAAAAPTNDTESKCQAKMAKSVGKVWKTAAKVIAKCRDAEIAGKVSLPCPDAKGQAKIDKASAKITSTIVKSCGSVCSTSTLVSCLNDATCPPDGTGAEACDGGGSADPFDLANLGFPGALCPAILDGSIGGPGDLGDCLVSASRVNYETFVETLYGTVDSGTGITSSAAKCLSSASKAAQKQVNTIYKSVSKCRDAVNKGKLDVTPTRCKLDDPKTVGAIAKGDEKLQAQLQSKCADGDVAQLDICGNGLGGTLTAAAAAACLSDAADELGDTLDAAPDRDHAKVSLIDVAFPSSAPVCGDDVVNQVRDGHLLIGEECDGRDDDACPGECLPPGDLFECTCGDVPRYLNIGIGGETDIGWTGISHDHVLQPGSATMQEVSNCDCDEMNGAECTGSSTDSVCDINGSQYPICSWDVVTSTTSCDDRGNNDSLPEDSDCAVCDSLSANAGAYCEDEADCQSQCRDASGDPTGLCASQADCGAGEVCRGRCDTTPTCLELEHGPPLPQVSAGSPSCLLSLFTDNLVGTQNIVTGEHERFLRRRAISHSGELLARPCPVCGGVCEDSANAELLGRTCEGTCSISTDRCRFDTDCPGGETCTTVSPECGTGFCNLDLVCTGGIDAGKPCRVHGPPGPFGTTSTDCRPNPGDNFSGAGSQSDFLPSTSEAVSLDPAAYACSNPASSLYDCPCPAEGGFPTRPNLCNFACNAGAELGTGCATGSAPPTGQPTRCVGGDNDGAACDDEADCAPGGGSCSDSPTHCVGDPAFALAACSTNGDCGTGACVDACPSGYCVNLCVPKSGTPGTVLTPVEEGECAAGPDPGQCSGESFRTCTSAGDTCAATCSIAGTPCVAQAECPLGETCDGPCDSAAGCEAGIDGVLGTIDDRPGAGICVGEPRACFLPGLATEGGDTLNGNGDPVMQYSVAVYCIPRNLSAAANFAAGLGGPGRIRSTSVNVTNGFTSLP